MEYDIAHLTFLADPTTYQMQSNELYTHVPDDISSAAELIDFLKESLHLPAYCGNSWDALSDVLRYWDDWSILPPQRVVILHTQLPFLRSSKNGWFDLKNYIEVLIESIIARQERNATEIDHSKHKELIIIFPEQTIEETQVTLNHPPAWEMDIRCLEYYLANEFAPSWERAHEYLTYLDGLTAEDCILFRQDIGSMTITYNKHDKTYWIEYQSANQEERMVVSPENTPSLPSSGVPLALASQILETFFVHGECTSSVYWHVLSPEDQGILNIKYKNWYYRNKEEHFLEATGGMSLETIRQGLAQAAYHGETAFSLTYWQDVLAQPVVPLLKRLTALCLVSFSTLPDAAELLRPFLYSSVKQERWVSARFFGIEQDEDALPVLLSMLTDELPIVGRTSGAELDEYWYDGWRSYAPRLLRKWQTPEVGKQLRDALVVWIQAEPQFDQNIEIWRNYEKELCYELGYRGDLTALPDLPMEYQHKRELLSAMEQGNKIKKQHLTPREEYEYNQGYE